MNKFYLLLLIPAVSMARLPECPTEPYKLEHTLCEVQNVDIDGDGIKIDQPCTELMKTTIAHWIWSDGHSSLEVYEDGSYGVALFLIRDGACDVLRVRQGRVFELGPDGPTNWHPDAKAFVDKVEGLVGEN